MGAARYVFDGGEARQAFKKIHKMSMLDMVQSTVAEEQKVMVCGTSVPLAIVFFLIQMLKQNINIYLALNQKKNLKKKCTCWF